MEGEYNIENKDNEIIEHCCGCGIVLSSKKHQVLQKGRLLIVDSRLFELLNNPPKDLSGLYCEQCLLEELNKWIDKEKSNRKINDEVKISKRYDLEFDTGFTLYAWKRKSEIGELCGILGCFNKPKIKCDHCGNHYCNEHKWVLNTPVHANKTK